jgi:DNA-binding response OmpR family regulator
VRTDLEHAGYAVSCAAAGRAGLELLASAGPELVVLDLMLPDITGEEVCRLIRRQSAVPILMLTAKVEETSLLQGFNIGADDYLTKPFSPRELVARVAALLRRAPGGHPGADSRLPAVLGSADGRLVLDPGRCRLERDGRPVELTGTELRLLALFMASPERVFGREEIVRQVAGADHDVDPRAVDAHIKNLRHKIEPDPRRPVYIRTVYGMGYAFGGQDGRDGAGR